MIKNIIEEKKTLITYICMICLIVLSVYTHGIGSILALAIFMLFAVNATTTETLNILYGIIPFANIFKIGPNSLSFLTLLEIITVGLYLCRTRRFKKTTLFWICVLIAGLVLEALNGFTINLMIVIKHIVRIMLLSSITGDKSKPEDVMSIGFYFSISMILSLAITNVQSFYLKVQPYLDMNVEMVNSVAVLRQSGLFNDPNYCSLALTMAFTLLLVLYKTGKINYEFWLLAAFLVPLGFMTYSKSYFLIMSALTMYLLLFVLLPKHRGMFIIAMVGVCVFIIQVSRGNVPVVNTLLQRFITQDLTTGRMDLNEEFISYIWGNNKVLFFGAGIAADRIAGVWNNVHNFYIDYLYKFGIIGGLVFLFTLCSCFAPISNKISARNDLVKLLPLASMLIVYFFLAGINMFDFYYYVMISFFCLRINTPREET